MSQLTNGTDNAPARGGFLTKSRWNPYLVGVGIGILSWAAFAVSGHPIGMSTSLSAASGACALPFLGADGVAKNAYWAKTSPKWDYGMLFLVSTAAGALVSSLVSRSFKLETVPEVWRERYGASPAKRLLAAFAGGVIILYGARMAGGCTSGHGISGSLQLALSSWVFFVVMFVSGIVTAGVMFGFGRASR